MSAPAFLTHHAVARLTRATYYIYVPSKNPSERHASHHRSPSSKDQTAAAQPPTFRPSAMTPTRHSPAVVAVALLVAVLAAEAGGTRATAASRRRRSASAPGTWPAWTTRSRRSAAGGWATSRTWRRARTSAGTSARASCRRCSPSVRSTPAAPPASRPRAASASGSSRPAPTLTAP
ncbi:hypothetical protein VPH35_135275 [Triticum aestivum]